MDPLLGSIPHCEVLGIYTFRAEINKAKREGENVFALRQATCQAVWWHCLCGGGSHRSTKAGKEESGRRASTPKA